jgi:hypothetical protein
MSWLSTTASRSVLVATQSVEKVTGGGRIQALFNADLDLVAEDGTDRLERLPRACRGGAQYERGFNPLPPEMVGDHRRRAAPPGS